MMIEVSQQDLYILVSSTVRYAFGRKSGIAYEVVLLCEKYAKHLEPWQRAQIAQEIEVEIKKYHGFNSTCGSQCDEDQFVKAVEVLRWSK